MDQSPHRISHAIYCVEPTDFDACRSFWQDAMGVELEDVPLPEAAGVRVAWSFAHGIELLSPVGPTAKPEYREFLSRCGNGLYAIVYRVPDLEAATARVEATGVTITGRASYTGRSPWSDTFRVLDESMPEPQHGMRVVLAQIEPRT